MNILLDDDNEALHCAQLALHSAVQSLAVCAQFWGAARAALRRSLLAVPALGRGKGLETGTRASLSATPCVVIPQTGKSSSSLNSTTTYFAQCGRVSSAFPGEKQNYFLSHFFNWKN